MSRNIVRHLRFSKSEYEAICSKAEYLKIPEVGSYAKLLFRKI